MKDSKITQLLFFFVITAVLTLNFYNNFWGVAKASMFDTFDIYCQSQVLGRVNLAEKEGVFARGGFTGWVRDTANMTWDEMLELQFKYYKENSTPPIYNFVFYESQIGGQGITLAALDKISPFSNSVNLKLFWIIMSFSTAILLAFFIMWVKRNYGFVVSIITFVFIFISLWLTLYGRNLYFVISTYYLPFIVVLFLLDKESRTFEKKMSLKLFVISLLLVLVKLFFSGFEFITTALVMITIPLFHYLFLNKWKIKFFIKRFLSVSSGAITAVVLYMMAHIYQLSKIKGGLLEGLNFILWDFSKRSYGNSAEFEAAFKDSLESNVFFVVGRYFTTMVFDLPFFQMNILVIFLILILFTVFVSKSEKISESIHRNRDKLKVLVYTTWVSMLAPLSWFVIFKAHSYVHGGYNGIVWFMPFCLFAFAFIGTMIYYLSKDFFGYIKNRRKANSSI